MILIFIAAAASQIIYDELKAPEMPPPFSAKVEVQVRTLGARVGEEHDKCNGPFMSANATYVEALGSPAHSPEWEKAKLAQHEMIQACQGYRSALRAQMDFMQRIVANGSRHDAKIAMAALGTYTFVVKGEEDQLLQATLDYDELVTFGRGRNKDGGDPNGKQ